jgi:hypothetical protein
MNMQDLFFIGLTLVFFALSAAYASVCEKLR